jgi:type II secretory pathway pseudopilin PulG
MKNSLKQSSKGRTLLELTMTLGLLSLLAGISAPQFAATKQLLEVKRVTSQIEELASQLTILAQQQGEELVLREISDNLRLSTNINAGKMLRQIKLPSTITIIINTSGKRILAYPSGAISPAKIIISNKIRRCSITISLWGRVRSSCQ